MGLAFLLINDDWTLDGLGKPKRIEGINKLKRDLEKFFKTEKIKDYGQELDSLIGDKIKSTQSILTETKRKIIDTLQRFTNWQGNDLTIDKDEQLESAQTFVYPDIEISTNIGFTLKLYNSSKQSLKETFSVGGII